MSETKEDPKVENTGAAAVKESGEVVNGGDIEQLEFDLEGLKKHFESSISEDGENVILEEYLAGYEELFKFLNMLGTVFGWVASDVKAKMEILHGHRKDDKNKDNYRDLKGMLEYETGAGVIKPKAKDSSTGARNFLRLHRALEYIFTFLDTVQVIF